MRYADGVRSVNLIARNAGASMKIQPRIRMIVAVAVCCAVVGCLQLGDNKSLKYLGDANLSYYRDQATKIEYPYLEEESPNPSIVTQPPRRIRHPRKDDLQNLPLAKAIQMAIANNKIIRDRNQFMSPLNPLLVGPNLSNNSIYDPSLQETGVSICNRGFNSLLRDVDASGTTNMQNGRAYV